MPPYNTEAPVEVPETSNPSPDPSIIESLLSESPLQSDNEVSSSDSDCAVDTYTLAAPGYEKIRIPLEQNLKQLLTKVADTDDLETVHKIKLRVIAQDFSLQRLPIYIPELKELDLNGSVLLSLRDLGCNLNSLTILNVTRCGLNSLDGLFGLQTLVELHAGSNKIDDLSPCSSLPYIERLDLRNNLIQDINTVTFLTLCETLKHLALDGCPTSEIQNYRSIVKKTLPNLLSLDNIEYNDELEDSIIATESEAETAGSNQIFPPVSNSNIQKISDKRFDKRSKRPNTCDGSGHRKIAVSLPMRPATARKATPIYTEDNYASIVDASEIRLKDLRTLFVPSKLTSGKALCGSPALAIREWRKIQAWGEVLAEE